ncbi:MAG: tRNA preQ1(34) S-adenosylmethionine ribosyltransferase-isomerase QueA [Candidatus Komeilibacteria bacterium]|nr:tRNA preQ1(34) S-adenosylmethionine ribosyltransferase-isomerase QueA [Candidatus Komeilibacteria bacterium]
MKLADFDYFLPKKLIAQSPVKPRDYCRLLVVRNDKKLILEHRHFYDLVNYLKAGDVLVLNQTKVFPCRLMGKKSTGGKIEIFLLKQQQGTEWEVLVGSHRKQVGQIINFGHGLSGQLIKKLTEKIWLFKFNQAQNKIMSLVAKVGQTPTPPYIKQLAALPDYQTVFARNSGSVAAPTAGLHFTKKLLNQLKRQGVQIEYVTLHVGLGTFQEVTAEDITKHHLHSEWVEVDKPTADRINLAKKQHRRIIAVGTTSLRLLEAMSVNGQLQFGKQWVNIFIYPGYKFKIVNGLITNFHLPKSSLIMLVAALVGIKNVQKVYQAAIKKKYRFYSFGDAMFIQPS